jgi:nitrite reductase/ring-hydroxylating ferredoxin subunit
LSTRTFQLFVSLMLLTSCLNDRDDTRVRVGRLDDFPVDTVISIELETSFLDPDPPAIGSRTPGVVTQPTSATISPVPVFLVHNPTAGILALYNRDPYLGCQVVWKAEIQRFVNPCHGQQYSQTGECIAEPCPRGLDRFKVVVTEEGEVWVDVSNFQFGPVRK